MPRLIPLPLVLLVVAGCGSSGDTTSTTPAPRQTTTTTALTTTTLLPPATAATTTTTSPPTTPTVPTIEEPTTTGPGGDDRYVVGAEPGVYPRPDNSTGPLPGSEGAGGSGCARGSTGLLDGIWFGLVTAKADTSITFDLACFFFGPIAVEEGANDGIVVDPIGEVYIRNTNPTVRTITVDPSVSVYEYDGLTEIPFNSVSFADWPQDPTFSQPCPGKFCGVWLFVNDDAVTEMLEQFFAPCVGSSTFNCVPVVW